MATKNSAGVSSFEQWKREIQSQAAELVEPNIFTRHELWVRANKIRLNEYAQATPHYGSFRKFILHYHSWPPLAARKEGDPYWDVSNEMRHDGNEPRRDLKLFEYLHEKIPAEHEDLVDDLWLAYQQAKLLRREVQK